MRLCFSVCNRRFLTGVIMFMLLYPMSVFAVQGQIAVQGKAMSIKQAIQVIEKNSKYTFFYKAADLSNAKIRDIHCEGSIEEVLNVLFKDSGISYVIKDNEVILKSTPVVVATPQQSNKIVVKGNIRDTLGESVIGATIMEKNNAQNGSISDINGDFSLSVSPGAVIVISYIGYVTQELKAIAGAPLKVVLKDDSRTLDEVVVVGFGSQKKANLTGAVSSIKMDEIIGDRPIMTASDALQGTVPGLLVSNSGNAPGSGKSFQLRGAYSVGIKNSDGSYGANVAPLILIDNVEGSLDMLNPEDIETVTVLKDAASAAIYGARAAGGVVLVTTKRPKEATAFRLNYNNNFGFATATNLPKQASLMDYLQAYQDGGYSDAYWSYGSPSVSKWKEYLTQYRQDPSSIKTVGDGIFADTDGALYYLNEHDPYKNFMETSFQMNHNLSVSGGTDKLRYRMSAGYVSTDGVLITDKDTYERLNINSYISADITKWFTQELTMSYARTNQSQPNSGLGSMFGSNQVSYQPEGNMPSDVCSTISQDLPFNTPRNQVLLANKWKKSYDNPRVFVKSILKPFKGFEAVFEYTFDKNMYDYNFYTGKTQYTDIQGGNNIWNAAKDYLQKEKQFTDYNAFNIYGTYKFDLNKDHHFSVMAGFNQESKYTEGVNVLSYNQAVVEVPALGSGTGDLKATDSYNEYSVRGGFFRVNYNYMDKYLLEVNGRYDGSSKFPKDSRFGFFPSVSAAWRISAEPFMEPFSGVLSNLKLRTSWGRAGTDNIGQFQYMSAYGTGGDAVFGGQNPEIAPGYTETRFPNPNITWETSEMFNIGIDASFFNGKLNLEADWFYKKTNDILRERTDMPAILGYKLPAANVGKVDNRGIDLNITHRNHLRDFNYSIAGNLTWARNKVIDLLEPAGEKNNPRQRSTGHSMSQYFGYEALGLFQSDEEANNWPQPQFGKAKAGDIKYKDQNGDGIIDAEDEIAIGRSNYPELVYGLNLNAEWKGFDITFFFQGAALADFYYNGYLAFPYIEGRGGALLEHHIGNTWTPENPKAEFPRLYYGGNANNQLFSSFWMRNGSYLRLKNVEIGYDFKKLLLSKVSEIQGLRLYFSGSNLLTWSQIKYFDPELRSTDGSAYPQMKTFVFGANITF